jgi:catechol 2,3-dioxygenase-like lactoylglutathione lyase family enzyme
MHMAVAGMNHFTILTDNLEKTLSFYDEHLGLRPGARPPFTFPGAWLYAEGGSEPILHIVAGIEKQRLVKGVIAYELRKLPAYGTWQLFFHDPNGAKVEIDFDPAEAAPA